MKLIDKDKVVAEIEKRKNCYENIQMIKPVYESNVEDFNELLSFINTLEVREVDNWHLQEKEDIYDAVKDWSLHTFACVMKDGTIQRFTGNRDEDCEGHINVYIDGANDDYDNVDDIVKWIELT